MNKVLPQFFGTSGHSVFASERRVLRLQDELLPHQGKANVELGIVSIIVTKQVIRGFPHSHQASAEDGLPLIKDFEGGVKDRRHCNQLWERDGWERGWMVEGRVGEGMDGRGMDGRGNG